MRWFTGYHPQPRPHPQHTTLHTQQPPQPPLPPHLQMQPQVRVRRVEGPEHQAARVPRDDRGAHGRHVELALEAVEDDELAARHGDAHPFAAVDDDRAADLLYDVMWYEGGERGWVRYGHVMGYGKIRRGVDKQAVSERDTNE